MKSSHSGVAAQLGGLVLALTLLVPAVAGAAVRSVTFMYERPTQPPSLTAEPPSDDDGNPVQSTDASRPRSLA